MMFGKFIDSSTVTGTQIRLDNEQWLRGRNFANTGDLNILRINSLNQIEFKQIPYVEGQGRLALYSELDGILTSVEYLYGQLTEVTGDIATIQGDIVDIQAEIDALQEEVGDFAFKDLSNLTATAIPSGINLESVSIDQSSITGFSLRTKNQTTSISGRINIRTGTSDSSFSSGGINIDSGAVTNAIGAAATTVMTGAVALVSGTISSGTRGSTGTAFLRSGGIANISSATTYSGNSGTVGVSSGTIQSSFNGATVTGNSGFASLQTGAIIATISGATANGTSGSISVSTGGINTFAAGAIVNGNSGPLSFTSGGVTGFGTSNSNTGTVSVFSGNVTNANNTGNTGNVSIFSGSNSGTGGSGSLSISTGQSSISGNTGNITINTGVAVSGNTGDVNISTGIPVSGTQGDIRLTSPFVKLLNYTRLVLEDNLGDRLVRLQLDSPTAEGYGQFFFNRIRSDKEVFIGAMESHVDDNGADVLFSGTFSLSDNDGQYRTSNVFLQTNAESGFRDAPNVAVDTGDVTIKTGNAFVQGSYTDASSGNISITTGTNQGSGSRGIVSIDGEYISVSSKQIKYLADGTDPSDAVTVSQLGSISGSFALTDLSNLVSPTLIPDGVGLNSVSTTSFSISTSSNNTTDPTGAIDVHTGDINNVASSANTGIMGIRSGETNGSGNTGEVQIYSGNNTGTGSSGNIVISAGTTADDDKTTGSIEIRSGFPFGNSNSGSINIYSHNAQKRTGDVALYSGSSTSVGDSGHILIYSGTVASGVRGSIDLNGQVTSVRVTNYDVTGNHSLFQVSNASPGQIGSIQFLSYAMGNNTMGIRIFDSASTSGFSINGWGRVNENGGPFDFMSTKASPTVDGTLTGGDFNIVSASTQYVDPALGINASVNSGNVNISTDNGYITGSNTDANSGNINLVTGQPQGTGTRGSVLLDGRVVSADIDVHFKVTNPGSASEVWLGNTSYGQLGGPYLYAIGIANNRTFEIGGQGLPDQNPGLTELHGAAIISSIDGSYVSGEIDIHTKIQTGTNATNASYSSGDINIYSDDADVYGTGYPDANTGNVNISTGTPQGSGTRGFISLDGDYVTASSTQIKDVADPTDPQDALTLNYFNNNIPNVAALDFYPLQAYNTYAPIYADATAGVLDPVTPTNPRPGWYFKNSAGSPQKINWYFFDGAVVSCQLQNFAAFAVVTLDSIASLPYFIFYTFPTGSGDVIPGFAHSQVVYSAPYVPSAVVGTKYLIYFGAEPDVFPYLPRIELTYNASASGGDQGATELVSTAAFSTESGASANNVQVMVENLGLNISTFKAYFNLLIFPVFEESQDYYGSFYSTQDQDNLVPDIARAMTFNNTDEANGVSIVSTSQITFTSGGLYNVQFSAQFTHSNSSSQDVDIWLSKNGTNVPYTNSRETLAGQVSVISAWNFFVRVNAGDYVEIYWSSPSNDVVIEYTGTQTVPTRPETPSIILTVNKIIS